MLSIGLALKGYTIKANDGPFGTVADFLFEDTSWMIRWLVVDVGSWFVGRLVLIHPSSIAQIDHGARELNVRLSHAEIKGSPEITTDQPVSRQMQHALYGYYGFDPLWGGGMGLPMPPSSYAMDSIALEAAGCAGEGEGDPHLRSLEAIAGYHIQAIDGPIGHIEDFLIDETTWSLRYLVIDTSNWWMGQHVVVSPHAVSKIEWLDRSIDLNLFQDTVKGSPPWLPEHIDSAAYRGSLNDYYGWPAFQQAD